MPRRWLRLPNQGTLLVSTDLHGNGADFRALRSLFLSHLERDSHTHWVILGDVVHAPSEEAKRRRPRLYDYPDESLAIVQGILELQRTHSQQVHFVLGNHDFGHIGGPHTGKFHTDEVENLEAQLDAEGRQTLQKLFTSALLAVVAPCGVLLAHGSPDDTLRSLEDLDAIPLPPTWDNPYHVRLLDTFLTSYGQPGAVTGHLLARLSREDLPLALVIHGHDRDEAGFFFEGGNQVCPVIFGAPRENKRYVLLDLATHYSTFHAIRDGWEIRRLHA